MKRIALALALVALTATSALAQPGIGIRGIGVNAGFVTPEDGESTLGFGVMADIGLLIPSFSIAPYVDYWKDSEEIAGAGEISARDIAVGARVLYSVGPPNPALSPFIGAGAGLHFAKAESTLDGFAFDESNTELGFDVGGGVGLGLGGFQLRGEGWYSFVDGLNYSSVKLGLMFPFGG